MVRFVILSQQNVMRTWRTYAEFQDIFKYQGKEFVQIDVCLDQKYLPYIDY